MAWKKAYYAHAYFHGAQTIAGSGARIIPSLTLGVASGFTLDAGNDSLIVPVTGVYAIKYSVSAKDNTSSNNGIQTFISYSDNVANILAGSYGQAYCVTQNRAQCIVGVCIASLTAALPIEIAIQNLTTANHDILIENASIIITRVD